MSDGWKCRYPGREWQAFEHEMRGGREATWSADADSVECEVRCSGYGGYSDSSSLPIELLRQLLLPHGYDIVKHAPQIGESSAPATVKTAGNVDGSE